MHAQLRKILYTLLKVPLIGPATRFVLRQFFALQFADSESYWLRRYERGRTSGPGSYDKLAEYKAEVINRFVADQQLTTVIEFGCGDGNQLRFAQYPHYTGYDISPLALELCRQRFATDPSKRFREMKDYAGETAELTLSLDVIYHLTEDATFDAYMRRLFAAATRYVIIYSSNKDEQDDVVVAHVRHRRFTPWVEQHMPTWILAHHIPNRYSFADDPVAGSFADFYIYARQE
jgi:cyclopropane fatty-acyl-phospholipid synthase-like methyltransferase